MPLHIGETHFASGVAEGEALVVEAEEVQDVREHSDHILTTAQLARACGLSERTLFRKVRQALGITPYELMLRTRVQKAAEALIQTSERILDIALAHGFCDQSTFTQHFRKRVGLTPRAFRSRYRPAALAAPLATR